MASGKPSAAATPLRQPQQARSRKTREKIVQAAEDLFESKGYEATTTNSIARRARASVGTFYLYFPDKRAVLTEIFHKAVDQIFGRAMEGLKPEYWEKADLREGIGALIAGVLDSRDVRPGIQRILHERYFKDPAIKTAMDAMLQEGVQAILGLMDTLSDRLRVRDREAAAFVIYATVDALAARVMIAESPIDPKRLTTQLTDLISRYLFED
ncbi:MAG: TetR/AcrR family transcriptional regulator [Deltaproteobacteria bacterium]|nr:TetR/AcrR family transcriptional regulator [Deltaproteobacteria bacterium]